MAIALLFAVVLVAQCKPIGRTMNVVVLGDSNSWLGGDGCDKPEGWTLWFKQALKPTSCRSYARSGATWTCTAKTRRNVIEDIETLGDDNVIYNQICRLQEAVSDGKQPAPDLIYISAGTNDVWFKAKRPNALSVDGVTSKQLKGVKAKPASKLLTLAAAVTNGCMTLKSLYPNAKIILLTPMQTTKASAADIERAGDIIESCARTMGVYWIRLDKQSCVKRQTELRKFTYTKDGTHTNEAGAKLNGKLVADETITIMLQGNCLTAGASLMRVDETAQVLRQSKQQ